MAKQKKRNAQMNRAKKRAERKNISRQKQEIHSYLRDSHDATLAARKKGKDVYVTPDPSNLAISIGELRRRALKG